MFTPEHSLHGALLCTADQAYLIEVSEDHSTAYGYPVISDGTCPVDARLAEIIDRREWVNVTVADPDSQELFAICLSSNIIDQGRELNFGMYYKCDIDQVMGLFESSVNLYGLLITRGRRTFLLDDLLSAIDTGVFTKRFPILPMIVYGTAYEAKLKVINAIPDAVELSKNNNMNMLMYVLNMGMFKVAAAMRWAAFRHCWDKYGTTNTQLEEQITYVMAKSDQTEVQNVFDIARDIAEGGISEPMPPIVTELMRDLREILGLSEAYHTLRTYCEVCGMDIRMNCITMIFKKQMDRVDGEPLKRSNVIVRRETAQETMEKIQGLIEGVQHRS